jgi:hypothetical protein
MKRKKCDRPGCKAHGTVVIRNGLKSLCVCQKDVLWAHKTLYPQVTKPLNASLGERGQP